MTNQPIWNLLANLGDVNPIDYGGYFIYKDTTNMYAPEGEILESPDNDTGAWTVYRFSLDRLKMVKGYMVSGRYRSDWPHPLHSYQEWFSTSDSGLESVARCFGINVESLQSMFCSDDILQRANAYRMIGDYYGFENLDSYPLTFRSRAEVEARYAEEVQ